MMSMFSTSPHISGTGVSSFASPTCLAYPNRYERSPDSQMGFFRTNPNTLPVFSNEGRNVLFREISTQPRTDGGGSAKQPLATHQIEDYFYHSNQTPIQDVRERSRIWKGSPHDFKTLKKEERQQILEGEAEGVDLLARTVHLRFLPTWMKQGELADLCHTCGEYQRVRICGNTTRNKNRIYGFVEFASRDGAGQMIKLSGMELPNGPGRPPLRLRCSAAKQCIVDRVFHDANPETGIPCMFGSGTFASRTLKDALESYFKLKTKGVEQQKSKQPLVEETWRINSGTVASLSPNALSFCPIFRTATHPISVVAPTRLEDSSMALFSSTSSGITPPTFTDSNCSDSPGGITPRFYVPPLPPSPIISEFVITTGGTVPSHNPFQNPLSFNFRTTSAH